MMRQRLTIFAAMLFAAPALGQALQPVDQTVEDLDPHAASQRNIDPGIGQFSQQGSLYRPLDATDFGATGLSVHPGTGLLLQGNFLYESPGVRAWTGRPDYLVVTNTDPQQPKFNYNVQPAVDGGFIDVIPAGTIFDLTLPTAPVLAPVENDQRLNFQLDARVEQMVDPFDQSMPRPIVGYGQPVVVEPSVQKPRRSAPEAEVVEEPDAAETTRDESDDPAG